MKRGILIMAVLLAAAVVTARIYARRCASNYGDTLAKVVNITLTFEIPPQVVDTEVPWPKEDKKMTLAFVRDLKEGMSPLGQE
jgi:hypothetical protein